MQTLNRYQDLALVRARIGAQLANGWLAQDRRIPQIQEMVGYDQADHACVLNVLDELLQAGELIRHMEGGLFYFRQPTPAERAEREMLAILLSDWLDQPRTIQQIIQRVGHDALGTIDTLLAWQKTGTQGWEAGGIIKRWTARDGQVYYCTIAPEQLMFNGCDTNLLPQDVFKRAKRSR